MSPYRSTVKRLKRKPHPPAPKRVSDKELVEAKEFWMHEHGRRCLVATIIEELQQLHARPAFNIDEAMMSIDAIRVPVVYDETKNDFSLRPFSIQCPDAIKEIRDILTKVLEGK